MISTMPALSWTFPARLVRVIDGDTLLLALDVGFASVRTERVRLLGINTPEVVGATRAAGLAATRFVEAWVLPSTEPWPLMVQTVKTDAFGRYLALVWRRSDGASLTDDLLAAGHAVPYKEPTA